MKKTLALVFGVIVLVVVGFLLWLTRPYMKYEYVRDNQAVTIDAEYTNATGDPLCTKIYLVVDDNISDHGIFPNVPEGIPDPNESPLLKFGDRMTLTGYLYEWRATNLVTGTTSSRKIYMMDVLGWRTSDKAAFQIADSRLPSSAFARINYTDCRP